MSKNEQNATSTVVAQLRLDAALVTQNTYTLYYQRSFEQIECTSIKDLCTILLKEEEPPYKVDFPNGLSILWNAFDAHYFANKSSLTQKQFVESCLIQKGGLS